MRWEAAHVRTSRGSGRALHQARDLGGSGNAPGLMPAPPTSSRMTARLPGQGASKPGTVDSDSAQQLELAAAQHPARQMALLSAAGDTATP